MLDFYLFFCYNTTSPLETRIRTESDRMEREIKILGAGIAGLGAGIIFAKKGYEVKIYEKTSHPGGRFKGDWQHLENWTSDIDVLKRLKSLGLEINFFTKACYKMSIFSSSFKEISFESTRPLFYSVQRGNPKESIDNGLLRQAQKLGAKVYFKKSMKEEDVDIVATGPKGSKETVGYTAGLNFTSGEKDRVFVLIDKDVSRLYSYFSIIDGKGTLAISSPNLKDVGKTLSRFRGKIKELLDIEIKDGEFFQARGGSLAGQSPLFEKDGIFYLGEAAGLQDRFAGFSIMPAFQSAYLAAKAIAEGESYTKLCRKEILPQIRACFVNSFITRIIPSSFLNHLVPAVAGIRNDSREVLQRAYNESMIHKALFPICWQINKLLK